MRRISIIIVLTLFSAALWGQLEKGTYSIQPKLGLNIATLDSYTHQVDTRNPDGSTAPRYSVLFSIEAEYQFCTKTGIVLGIQYSMQGQRESFSTNRAKIKATDKLDYINIPILAKFYVAKNLSLKVGLQPAFNVRHDYELDTAVSISYWAGGEQYDLPQKGSLSDIGIKIKPFDLAIPIGIAYEIEHGMNKRLVAEARWNFGLLKVANMEDGSDPKNGVFQLSLGYMFNL